SQGHRENDILGLGPISKDEALQRANAGETPVAVTERAQDGTELKAATGTVGTAPIQVASLEAQKAPGSTVQVEEPTRVLNDRLASNSSTMAPWKMNWGAPARESQQAQSDAPTLTTSTGRLYVSPATVKPWEMQWSNSGDDAASKPSADR